MNNTICFNEGKCVNISCECVGNWGGDNCQLTQLQEKSIFFFGIFGIICLIISLMICFFRRGSYCYQKFCPENLGNPDIEIISRGI